MEDQFLVVSNSTILKELKPKIYFFAQSWLFHRHALFRPTASHFVDRHFLEKNIFSQQIHRQNFRQPNKYAAHSC